MMRGDRRDERRDEKWDDMPWEVWMGLMEKVVIGYHGTMWQFDGVIWVWG